MSDTYRNDDEMPEMNEGSSTFYFSADKHEEAEEEVKAESVWEERKESTSYDSTNGNSYMGGGSHYGFDQTDRVERQALSPFDEPEKKVKKGSGILKKGLALVLSAALFGGISGGTMLGIQYAGKKAGIIGASAGSGTTIKVVDNSVSSSGKTLEGTYTVGDVSGIVDSVLPSVVAITSTQIYEDYSDMFGSFFWGWGSNTPQQREVPSSGSGIIIGQNDDELLVVTNYHVIEDSTSLTVAFIDENSADAVVKGTDPDNDLAVVAVSLKDLSEETKNTIAIATLHTAEDLKVGQGVIAIGNALGYGQSVTVGYISALNRTVTSSDDTSRELLQTDAAINPGNSGGALINTDGEIIGINSAKYSDTSVEGMGFAIPISKVMDIIDDLMTRKTKVAVAENKRGYLGIMGITVDSKYAKAYNMPEGVYVSDILEDGAAAKSDLKERDIIVKIEGTRINSMDDLQGELKYYAVGEKITLTVKRLIDNDYQDVDIEVTLSKQISTDDEASAN